MHIRSGIFFTAKSFTFCRKGLVPGDLYLVHVLVKNLFRCLGLALDIDFPSRELCCQTGILPFLSYITTFLSLLVFHISTTDMLLCL